MHISTETKSPVRIAIRKPDQKPSPRVLNWKPQQSGLSRDEIRQIVLDTMG